MQDIAVKIENASKYYKLYNSPKDRLKEALNPFGKKYHKKFYAINNLNLEIKKGEVLGIVGKNGSGKSTLLKLITGVLMPDNGSVEVSGKISALLELGSGFNPEFTGIQNIYFYGTIHGFSRQEMDEKIDDIIAFSDIGEFINQPIKTYSSGMKSRLGFAVAVSIEPEILILDEVLSVGDVLFKRKCYTKMEEFFKGGKTIIYVSHDTNSVNELCNRAVLLYEGKVLLDSDAKTVTDTYQKILFSNNQDNKKILDKLKKRNDENEVLSKSEAFKPNLKCNKKHVNKSAFLPSLKSKPNDVNSKIACFKNVCIFDVQGKKVNRLEIYKEYKVYFEVLFKVKLKNVAIGVQIRNNQGVIISGVNTRDFMKKTITQVDNGENHKVNVTFICALTPGIYILVIFMNDDADCYAIQFDSFMFEVRKSDFKFGGYVLLNQKIEIEKMTHLGI